MQDETHKIIESFAESCQKIHDELNNNNQQKTIYHYTNFDGLVGIIGSRKLRYTDYRYLNDPTEIIYGQNLICESILRSGIENKYELEKKLRRLLKQINKDNYLYVACFSHDDDKLSLWRYYANNGTGFAIGFTEFQDIIPNGTIRESSLISEVIYRKETTLDILKKFISQYEIFMDRSRSAIIHDRDFFNKSMQVRLISNLLSFQPSLKDESFADEHEVRLIRMEGELLINPKTDQPFYFDDAIRDFIPFSTPENIPFVTATKGRKPVIYPEEFAHSAINKIIVGPCCQFIEARTAIRSLLKNSGYEADKIAIEPAKVQYRNI